MTLNWLSTHVGVAACLTLWTLTASGALAAQPAADLPDLQLAPLVAQFVKSCTKDFETNATVGAFYCPCAAAIVVDRLTVEELTKDESMTLEAMNAAHPGIAKLLKVCGLAAKLGTK